MSENLLTKSATLFKSLAGQAFNNLDGSVNCFDARIWAALGKAKTSIAKSLGMYTDFLSVFSANADLISDSISEGFNLNNPESGRIRGDDGKRDMDLIKSQYDSLDTFMSRYGNLEHVSGVTVRSINITDRSGRIYRLCHATQAGPSWDSKTFFFRWYDDFDDDGTGMGGGTRTFFRWWDSDHDKFLFDNVICDITGEKHVIWDVMSALVENSEIFNCLNDLVQVLTGITSGSTDVVSLASSWLQNGSSTIRDMGSAVISSWKTGGAYGVGMYVINYFKTQSSFTSEDGGLTFTDNSGLVPKVYLAGLISTVAQSAAYVAAGIAAAANPILGMIISVASSIVSIVNDKLRFDYSQTYASLQANTNAFLYASPHACAQGDMPFPDDEEVFEHDVYSILESSGVLSLAVPGGYILFTLKSGHLRFEFHPDLFDRSVELKTWMSHLYQSGDISISRTDVTSLEWQYDFSLLCDLTDPQRVEHFMATFSTISASNDSIQVQPDTGYLSDANDAKVRKIIVQNIAIFLLFCQLDNDDSLGFVGTMDYDDFEGEASWVGAHSSDSDSGVLGFMIRAVCWALQDLQAEPLFAEIAGYLKGPLSWAAIGTAMGYIASNVTYGVYNNRGLLFDHVLMLKTFYDTFVELPTNVEYPLKVPQYDRATFWMSVAAASAITIATVAITAVGFIAASRAIKTARLKNTIAVERAYNDAVDNPTPANIKAYKKAAFKNNVFATVFGGTKYASSGRWDTSETSSTTDGSTLISTVGATTGDNPKASSTDLGAQLSLIIRLIKGTDPESPQP